METTGAAQDPALGPRPATGRARTRVRLSAARLLVLETLENQPEPCTVASIARILHQHTNTVREHLDGLVDVGLALRERSTPMGPGRPSWLYRCADEPDAAASATEYAGLASALAAQIARSSADPQADALEAGRAWGRDLAAQLDSSLSDELPTDAPLPADAPFDKARTDVVGLLAELAFSPEPSADGLTVRLRRCPLLEAAHRNPDIVCAVHLGLVEGALEELGAPPSGARLLPFAEKGACRLHFEEPRA